MELKLKIEVFWSEEDDAWVAIIPSLKGCSALGETAAEAVQEVQQVAKAMAEIVSDRHSS